MAHLSTLGTRILRSACRAAIIGDSINSDLSSNQMPTAYHKTLTPTEWSGWGGQGLDNGSSLTGGIFNWAATAGIVNRGIYYTPSGGAGDIAIWPAHFGDLTFAGDMAVDGTIVVPYTDTTKMAEFSGGDWAAAAITCKFMVYRSSGGAVVGIPNVGSYTRRIPSTGIGTDTASNALANGYNLITQTLATANERADFLLDGANPNIVETGKNLYFLGWRFYKNETGLQLTPMGVGGAGVADLVNTALISNTAIAKAVELHNLNTIIVWIGQNDGTIDATWAIRVAALIDRWRTAIGASFRCLLINSHQTNTTNAAKVALMSGYLNGIANAADDVALLDLGTLDNGYALNNGLLADGVHTSAAGAVYFGTLINNHLLRSISPGGSKITIATALGI